MARQKKKGNPIVSAVVFGIFGIVLIFLGVRTFIGLHGNLLNVTTCDPSEVKPESTSKRRQPTITLSPKLMDITIW